MAENAEQDANPGESPPKDKVENFDAEFPRLFFVSDIESVKNVIANYTLRTRSQFCISRQSKNFASGWPIFEAFPQHKLFWQDRDGSFEKIPIDGVPFIVVGKRTLACTFGPDYRTLPNPKRNIPSRRVGCTAQISIREIHKFPSHRINLSHDTKRKRNNLMRDLRDKLIKKAGLGERRFYVTLPRLSDHQGHDFEKVCPDHNTPSVRNRTMRDLRDKLIKKMDLGERRYYVTMPRLSDHQGHDFDKDVTKMRTDPRVRAKLADLVYRRVFDVPTLREKITEYVREELFKGTTPPPLSDTRFYPPERRIRNSCYGTRAKMQNEGIAVPFFGPEMRAGKKTRGNTPAPKKRAKRKRKEVTPKCPPATAESNDAAEMLLMLDKDSRQQGQEDDDDDDVDMGAGDSPSDAEDSTSDVTSQKVITRLTADPQGTVIQGGNDTANNLEISQDVIHVELDSDKQDCLDVLEKLKPLIVFSQEMEKITNLKCLLENCIQDLEGNFG